MVEQVFGHAAMREHEFRSAARSGRERDGRHRVDSFGKICSTPCLDQTAAWNEIHIHSGDLSRVSREYAADFLADVGFAARDFRVLARIGEQVVDRLR